MPALQTHPSSGDTSSAPPFLCEPTTQLYHPMPIPTKTTTLRRKQHLSTGHPKRTSSLAQKYRNTSPPLGSFTSVCRRHMCFCSLLFSPVHRPETSPLHQSHHPPGVPGPRTQLQAQWRRRCPRQGICRRHAGQGRGTPAEGRWVQRRTSCGGLRYGGVWGDPWAHPAEFKTMSDVRISTKSTNTDD